MRLFLQWLRFRAGEISKWADRKIGEREALRIALEGAQGMVSVRDNPRGFCPHCHADLGTFYSNRIRWEKNDDK
jgi:hypothetical protein